MAKKTAKRTTKTAGDSSAPGSVSKAQQARDHKAQNPSATTQEIADAIKTSYNAVYQALKNAGGSRGKSKGKRGPKRKAPVAAHAALDSAFEFVQKVGGLVHAENLIDKLKAIKAKL
jgi:hypothetical protein